MNIRKRAEKLIKRRDNIQNELFELQRACSHEISVYVPKGNTGGLDYDDSHWYNFYCYDCKKRWSHDQELGYGNSLKVDEIDETINPKKIELEMKIREIK